ncbi:unnamed protein product, partial [Mesorhabditis belari]|uniref:Uncharacterized protein n=1 Tax=Mesorhabditis belari TaxID=2138241 RepID=A0AAF3FEZ1_9BILA
MMKFSIFQRKERPSPAPPATLPKGNIQHLINSDSEDEEVIFTKSMVQRLKGKIRDQEGGADSVQIRRPMGINGKEARSKTPDLDSKSVKSADSGTQSLPDGDRPLTPRTRDRVLREIAGVDIGDGKIGNDRKKYYFRRSMNVYHNTLRILESRKEECLYKEQ